MASRYKNSKKNYFTQDTEDAIIEYNNTQDYNQKSRIYGSRIHNAFFKLTQTNNKKSCLINGCLDTEPIGFFTNVLNRDKRIKSFNLMIDNTQNQYYTFVIDVKNNEIHNILENFKNL